MAFDPGTILPSTRWACLERSTNGRYRSICDAVLRVTDDQALCEELRTTLVARAEAVATLAQAAEGERLPLELRARAFRMAAEVAADLRALEGPAAP